MPAPVAAIHPTAAARLGIADGERVALVSPRGRIELAARVTDTVHPETVVVPSGWTEANVNLLTDTERLDPISGFPALRSMVCRVERLG
jgi:anaerobic selenocysteine-containing dehydrogenase